MAGNDSNGASGFSNASLPPSVTALSIAAARIKEIEAMQKALDEKSGGTKMAFQKLPKHMRRRAMSHAVKRLPRRLREIHLNQMNKSGVPPKSKKPHRKHRRRPGNLQSDYARRRRRVKWLDTHIWHAKRFHMIEKWGFKLPKQPCDKSFRACYRATAQHCLIQDISYERCIEISGAYEDIIQGLQDRTIIGLSFGAKCFKGGKKFGELTLFHCKRAIGDVHFFWNANNDALWLFVHPAYYKQVLEMLINLFELNLVEDLVENQLITSYTGSKKIGLKELEYELGRFRLTGPLSTAVLKNALRVVDFTDMHLAFNSWLHPYSIPTLSEQNQVFKNLTNTSNLPPNLLLSILVNDPRLNLPNKRTKASLTPNDESDDFDKLQQNLSLSPLWSHSIRKMLKDTKLSNASICEIRSQFLIPGTELSMDLETILPVMLMWRPGKKGASNNGYGSGWDVILPSSWSQSFFISFVMWGARAGGLRETESVAFEKSQLDVLYPDTEAGEREETFIMEESVEKFFRLPPNKRTNFVKFGISSPFSCNWKMLITEWSGKTCHVFTVLRDKTLLRQIQAYFVDKASLPTLPENCLIPIKVTPISKAVCSRFGIICLPGDCTEKEPIEPNCKDIFAVKRKKLRSEHKNLLKRLHKRRKRANKKGNPVTSTDKEILQVYKTEMRKLWLPEAETIKSSCSKTVMGFLKHGDFSFTLGRSKGLGYVVGDSLARLRGNKVLIRNTNSRRYKWAVIDVIVE